MKKRAWFLCLSALVTYTAFADCVPVPLGLVSWWRAEGNAGDAAGVNPGILKNGATFVAGKVGQAFSLNGIDQYVELSNSPSLNPAGSFTIEGWINHYDDVAAGIFCKWGDAGDYFNNRSYVLQTIAGGGLQFNIADLGHQYDDAFVYFKVPGVLTTSNWYHVAAVYDQSTGTRRLYLNGAQIGAKTDPPITVLNSGGKAAIGGNLNSSTTLQAPFHGLIDEISFYSRALDANEILGIYNAAAAGKCLGQAPSIMAEPQDQSVIAGSDVTLSATASGTPPLSYQWFFNGAEIAGATLALLQLENVGASQTGNYSLAVKNPYGTATSRTVALQVNAPSCAGISDGMVAWWKAENNADDVFRNADGSLVNGATFAPGRAGSAFSFNGTTSYVQVPDSDSWAFGSSDFTIEFWVNFRLLGSGTTILPEAVFIAQDEGTGVLPKWMVTLGARKLTFIVATRTTAEFLIQAPFSPELNRWYHLAITRHGTLFSAYRDGVLIGSQSSSFVIPNANAALTIGRGEAFYLNGLMDEVTIYNRALDAAELQAIQAAGSAGKCPGQAPSITAEPQDRSVVAGADVTISGTVSGTPPLSYQWFFNGAEIAGGTQASLELKNVAATQTGNYNLVVKNPYGTATSRTVVLQVTQPSCLAITNGMVGWWKGENSGADEFHLSDGSLEGGASFAAGRVGSAFSLNGTSSYVRIPDSDLWAFGSSDFTIEFWVNFRTLGSGTMIQPEAVLLANDEGSGYLPKWAITLGARKLSFHVATRTTADWLIQAPFSPELNRWYHLAISRHGSMFSAYRDGTLMASQSSSIVVPNPNAPLTIGQCEGGFFVNGLIDELSIYNRALDPAELQGIVSAGSAGKCPVMIPPTAPIVTTPPASKTVPAGSSVTFTVTTAGTQPLSYQWSFNGAPIAAATTSSLTLPNVQLSQTGTYSVVITNNVGATSATATLTVTPAAATVRASDVTVYAGNNATVPIVLSANGNENAVGFTASFDPAKLVFDSAQPGAATVNGSLIINTNQAPLGRLGVLVSAPFGTTYPPGNQEVAKLVFRTAVSTASRSASVAFTDDLVQRQLSDGSGNTLPATFQNGLVTINASLFEGDVAPRPGGDQKVTVSDWVLIGRFAAKLDIAPVPGPEFQKADCAPRATLGDAVISLTDWVQAGRYAAKLDDLTAAGGPDAPKAAGTATVMKKQNLARQVRVSNAALVQGGTASLNVLLQSQGDENGLSLSLGFDPGALRLADAKAGIDGAGGILQVNTNEVANGRVALLLALPTGNSFLAGERQLLVVTFAAVGIGPTESPVVIGDEPVAREISDAYAAALPADYIDGQVTIQPPPALMPEMSESLIRLSWPSWAKDFVLQRASSLRDDATEWTNVEQTPLVSGDRFSVSIPESGPAGFYRLNKSARP